MKLNPSIISLTTSIWLTLSLDKLKPVMSHSKKMRGIRIAYQL